MSASSRTVRVLTAGVKRDERFNSDPRRSLLTAAAIARLGPSEAYLLSASFIGAITLYLLLLTDRAGERLVPWSAGDVHPRNRAIHVAARLAASEEPQPVIN